MKKLIVLVAISVFSHLKSQYGSEKDWKIIATIFCTRLEGTYIGNKAFFSFGPKYPINENHYISLRGHFNWWDVPSRKLAVIPELDYLYKLASFEDDKLIFSNLYLGTGIMPNAVAPKFGLNFYNFFSTEFGYNFEFQPYKHFSTQGFRFSFGLNAVF